MKYAWWLFACICAGWFGSTAWSIDRSVSIVASHYESPEYDWAEAIMRGKKEKEQK